MTGRKKLVAILAFAAALTTLAACGNDEAPRAGETPGPSATSPTPSPTATTFTEDEWTITTPAGWTREVVTSSVDAKKAVKYGDAGGRYFIVAIDPLGSDFASDETWRYEVVGSSFTVAEKVKCTGEQCSTTDQRYDVYLVAKGNDIPTVGGHKYYFIFGNTTATTFEAALFEGILASIRATS